MTSSTDRVRASRDRAPSRRQWATAFHEAGHAVIALWLDARSLVRASIVPDAHEGTSGHVQRRRFRKDIDWDPLDEWVLRRRLEPEILIAYAGVLAEQRYSGRRHNWDGAASDMDWAADCLLKLQGGGGPAADAYAKYLWEQAKSMVATRWDAISRIAAALMDANVLDPKAIRRIAYEMPLESAQATE